MSQLFTPLKLRTLEFKNRIFVSPMCQYSARDGMPNDWHLAHYGARAVGGASLIIAEATAVCPEGRITPDDTGLWKDAQIEPFARITRFIKDQGSVPGIQLAHAGRKASTASPWNGGGPLSESQGGWQTIGPSALPFGPAYASPREMSHEEIGEQVRQFRDATLRALRAGFEVVEIHMAHGYLLHQFLSPLSNQRSDEYGGSLENRMRLPLAVAREIRALWPEKWPIFVRISATDWVDGGWDLEQSIALCRELKALGVDLIDTSTGGLVPNAKIPVGPGFQTPFAKAIRALGIATGAVGMITKPAQAEAIITAGDADAVLIAREILRDPNWPLHAAHALKATLRWPLQYERAKPADLE